MTILCPDLSLETCSPICRANLEEVIGRGPIKAVNPALSSIPIPRVHFTTRPQVNADGRRHEDNVGMGTMERCAADQAGLKELGSMILRRRERSVSLRVLR